MGSIFRFTAPYPCPGAGCGSAPVCGGPCKRCCPPLAEKWVKKWPSSGASPVSGQGVGFAFQTRRTDIAAQTGVSVQRVRGVSGKGPPHEPSEAGRVGRGGARERVPFSPSGGNGTKRTLRRRRARGAAPWTERSDAETAGCFHLQSAVLPRRTLLHMAVRLCIEVRPCFPRNFGPGATPQQMRSCLLAQITWDCPQKGHWYIWIGLAFFRIIFVVVDQNRRIIIPI